MKAIIGTAGHIDHGKTALVRALTGLDTDRLPEERERGISIELGFAYLELPGGDRAGIVDVPGHERFVRQMLAGAQGFDLMVLVVAADDGVMPQTEEHFEICHLLGIRKGIIVITKADLVSEARVEEVRDEIEILVAGTEFESAPIAVVSSQTGRGIEPLRDLVLAALATAERPETPGSFRMPIDRAFVLKGHGVVVTGTAASGRVRPGDELELAPAGLLVRVRDVHVHDAPVEQAGAGQRVALNLVGVARDQVRRGDCVAAPGLSTTSKRFDAAVEIRPSARAAVQSHQNVRVYVGTREVLGRILWLDGVQSVEPRQERYAQIVLREEAIVFAGDRFVLRDETAGRTLGGGQVLVARAHKHRRTEGKLAPRLRTLQEGDAAQRLSVLAELVHELGLTPEAAASGLGLDVATIRRTAATGATLALLPDPSTPKLIVSARRLREYRDALVAETEAFHRRHANMAGIELERLRASVHYEVDARTFRAIIDGLVEEGRLVRRRGSVAAPAHEVSMSDADESLARDLVDAVTEAGATPPTLKELQEHLQLATRRLHDVVGALCERGELVKVSPELVFAPQVLDVIERELRRYFQDADTITAAAFRDLIGASRKYSIPLLDHFDRSGVTVRSGDYRRLRGATAEIR